MPAVNNKILMWARETAGLSLEQAAKKLNINDNKKKTAIEKLTEIESGLVEPTRSQLFKMSKAYRRPLITFYLENPPEKGYRGQDFRTLVDSYSPFEYAQVDALIRDIMGRQNIIKSILEEEESEILPFINSVSTDDSITIVAEKIKKTISFDLKVFQSQKNISNAFKYLRTCVENSGVFVLLIGNLGSHHTNISPKIFRGFAIADTIAPFIVINDQDAKSAWAFTAFHELAHLWLGKTGISDFSTNIQIESFCNDVAGEILFPTRSLIEFKNLSGLSLESTSQQITNYSKKMKISRKMVAYKLYKFEIINKSTWEVLDKQYQEEWLKSKERDNQNNSSPDHYKIQVYKIGRTLISLIERSLQQGTITYTKAGKALGIVNPIRVQTLFDHASGGIK